MSIIFQSNTIQISKQSKSIFKMKFENGEKFNHFLKNIQQKLDTIKKEKNVFTFKAVKVEKLKTILQRKDSLSYRHLKELFNNIAKQLEDLENDGYCNLFFNINDIVRVELNTKNQVGRNTGNDILFLYLNTKNFLPVKQKITKIMKPFDKENLFISPELKKIKTFPIDIHMNSQLYSLAAFVCYCGEWHKNKKLFKNTEKNMDIYREYLSNIANTKLSWALLRCLEDKPNNRIYLFI